MKKTLALFMLLVLAIASFAQEEAEAAAPAAEPAQAEPAVESAEPAAAPAAEPAPAPEAKPKKFDSEDVMKMKYNVRAGVNFSSMEMKAASFGKISWGSGNSYKSFSSVTGFQVGGSVDIPLSLIEIGSDSYLLALNPGLSFIKKGGEYKGYYSLSSYNYGLPFSGKYTVDSYYLEVPVPVTFKKWFSEKLSASVEAGPYFAFGLFGEQKFVGGPWDLKQSSFDDGLGRFDVGVIYGASANYGKFYAGLMLGSGVTDDNVSTLYLNLGYKF